MRRITALAVAVAFSLTSIPIAAAGPRVERAAQVQTGSIAGTAHDAQGQALPNYTVRLRSLVNGQIAGSTTSNGAGQFTFTGLTPANYVIEIVNAAGAIVATSASIAVAAGATVSVVITASAAAAGAAPGSRADAPIGGASTAAIVAGVAAAAGVVG